MFFWIAAFVAEVPAVNSRGTKTFLDNHVSSFFINKKPAVISCFRKLENSVSWLVVFLVVSFYKIPLFSEDLITFIISFISLLVKFIPEPACFAIFPLNFSLIVSTVVSEKVWTASLFSKSLTCIFFFFFY